MDDVNWGRQMLTGWAGETKKGKRDYMKKIFQGFSSLDITIFIGRFRTEQEDFGFQIKVM